MEVRRRTGNSLPNSSKARLAGTDVQTYGTVTATSNSGREEVSVELYLGKVAAGPYFFSTTHEQDQASYYYPVPVKRFALGPGYEGSGGS